MIFKGNLSKMNTELDEVVHYTLPHESKPLDMNSLLGKRIRITFEGQINCIACGRKTKKAFGQGFCYPCFANAPENAECIIRPELCEGHEGKGRDPEWEKKHHVRDHFVYLALSSDVKVGVTRHDQIPTRWIDQGASQAIIIVQTPYRQLAGKIEVALKEYFTDKTQWQRMLKNEVKEGIDLLKMKEEALSKLAEEYKAYHYKDDTITTLNYPVNLWPTKVKSLNLLKTPVIDGTLIGIKAQYLIFEGNTVFNIRKHSGYHVEIETLPYQGQLSF